MTDTGGEIAHPGLTITVYRVNPETLERPVSPMWDDEPEPATGVCVACGTHTENGIARWLPRAPGPDVHLIVHARGEDYVQPEPVPPVRPARHHAGF
ncbi:MULTISPECIES: hypothetical protein [unclassified Streptomyces]|uniref:hypothetical protein n=1 Tax=unclassified Streptomyces TaxID=2593676 RepID=UPI00331BE00E